MHSWGLVALLFGSDYMLKCLPKNVITVVFCDAHSSQEIQEKVNA